MDRSAHIFLCPSDFCSLQRSLHRSSDCAPHTMGPKKARLDVTVKAEQGLDQPVADATLSHYFVGLNLSTSAVLKHKKFKELRASDGLGVDKGGSHPMFDKSLYDKMVAGKSDEYTCSGSIGWFSEMWQPIAGVPFNGSMVEDFKETRFKKPSRSAFPPSRPTPRPPELGDRRAPSVASDR